MFSALTSIPASISFTTAPPRVPTSTEVSVTTMFSSTTTVQNRIMVSEISVAP